MVIYPKIKNLIDLIYFPKPFQGDVSVKRWIINDPTQVIGVKKYTNEDSFNTIDWKVSAKKGELYVKKYDFTAEPSIMTYLDIQTNPIKWMGNDYELIEKGIDIIASLMNKALIERIPIGYTANTDYDNEDGDIFLYPSRSSKQRDRILEALAKLRFKQGNNYSMVSKQKYILLFLVLVEFLWVIQKFPQIVKVYWQLYLIICLLSYIQENIFKEYSDDTANVVNDKKNKKFFNMSLLFLSFISIVFFTANSHNKVFSYLKNFFSTTLYFILKPIASVVNLFYEYVLCNAVNWGGSPSGNINLISIVIISIIGGLFIFVFIYCIMLKKNIKLRKEYLGIWDSIRDRFISCMEKLGRTPIDMGKRDGVNNLHQIRKIYIDLVKILNKKGIDYDKSYTPNEYEEVIKNTELKDTDISEIIKIYNEVRYGNKSVSKEDIWRAYNIKKNMKKSPVHSSCK